jgi:hypothetical protein
MTAGYSGTPLAKKLGIKEGFLIVTVHRPENYLKLLEPAPAEILLLERPLYWMHVRDTGFQEDPDIIHLFTNSRDELFRELSDLRDLVKQDGAIWVSWYKKAAKLPTEITEDTIREVALPLGLVDVKVCAIDEKWSGLKLVIRRENRV